MTTARESRAPFERLADYLRGLIEDGELAAGDRLPSGRDLARDHGVALATAQSALHRLRDDGLATATPRGYFVSTTAKGEPAVTLQDVQDELARLTQRVEKLERGPRS